MVKNTRIFGEKHAMFGRSIRAMLRRRGLAWRPALAALAVVVASVAFLAPPAWAEGGGNPDAKAAWEKGRKLAGQKQWDAAADAFREASVIDPDPQYQLDLARALDGAGKVREASEALDKIDAAKDVSSGVREAADKLRARLEKRLATIVVTVTGGDGAAVIEIDGKAARSGEANRVDPGKHQLRAHAAGWVPIEMTLDLAEGKTESVPFKLERDPAAGGDAAPPPPPEEPPAESGGGTLLPAAIAWGVGAVGFGVGGIFGIFAFNEADKARENCDGDVCTEEAREAIDTSKTNGGAATAGFIVGGAGLVTGIVLAVVYGGGDDTTATASAPHVTPWFGGTSAGLDGSF